MSKATKDELWQYLLEQLEFLRASARSFDEGRHSEAKRLASATRTLLHDTGRSVSLLKQLKLLPGMAFWSTTRNPRIQPNASEFGWRAHLVHLQVSAAGMRYYAPGSVNDEPTDLRAQRLLFFPDWWNEAVITGTGGNTFNRRQVVLALANKLGGSHVDSSIPLALVDLVKNNPAGIYYRVGGSEEVVPMKELELHTMRQIAHEVLTSVERKLRA